jgi:hypothetical protein
MRHLRLYSALIVASVLVAAACSSDSVTTEPSAAPSFATASWSPSLAVCRTRSDSTVSKEIGWRGGSLSVNGNTLVIPRYALSSPVTITMSQEKGINSAVDLQPEGLQFAIPASLTLDYSDCNIKQSPASIVYLNPAGTYDELPSADNKANLQVTAQLPHFSNYAVAW